jgi:hypothetical protein
MSLRFACQDCGRLVRASERLAGKRMDCLHCGAAQRAPAAADEEAPPSSEPAVSREDALKLAARYSRAKAARRRRLRFILLFALPGVVYGIVSAYMNQNPFFGWFSATVDHISKIDYAAQWEPSPVWLPSYLHSQAGVGMSHTRGLGYYFSSFFGWLVFYLGSVLIAAAPCAALGALASAAAGGRAGRREA